MISRFLLRFCTFFPDLRFPRFSSFFQFFLRTGKFVRLCFRAKIEIYVKWANAQPLRSGLWISLRALQNRQQGDINVFNQWWCKLHHQKRLWTMNGFWRCSYSARAETHFLLPSFTSAGCCLSGKTENGCGPFEALWRPLGYLSLPYRKAHV